MQEQKQNNQDHQEKNSDNKNPTILVSLSDTIQDEEMKKIDKWINSANYTD